MSILKTVKALAKTTSDIIEYENKHNPKWAEKEARKEKKREEEKRFSSMSIPYEHKLIVRELATSQSMISDKLDRRNYAICDSCDNVKYRLKELIFDKEIYFAYEDNRVVLKKSMPFSVKNKANEIVGHIERQPDYVPYRDLFDKLNFKESYIELVKRCTIQTHNGKKLEIEANSRRNNPYSLKRNIEYGFVTSQLKMRVNSNETDFQIFDGTYASKPIIHIHKVRSDDLLFRKYIVGFDDETRELQAGLLAVAISLIDYRIL